MTPLWRHVKCCEIRKIPKVLRNKRRLRHIHVKPPLTLWNTKIHYRIHKSPAVASQIIPVHAKQLRFIKVYFNLSPSMSRSPKQCLSFRFPHWSPICTSLPSYACYMPLPSHPPLFHYPNNIQWSHYTSNSSSLCRFIHSRINATLLSFKNRVSYI
jgi:hypothetical protein